MFPASLGLTLTPSAFYAAGSCLLTTVPLALTVTISTGMFFFARVIACCIMRGIFEQHGTSMMRMVTLWMPAVLNISANLLMYSSVSSNLGHPRSTVLPLRKSRWKFGQATGVQSEATRRSAPFKKGAVGGTRLICTGQWERADEISDCEAGWFAASQSFPNIWRCVEGQPHGNKSRFPISDFRFPDCGFLMFPSLLSALRSPLLLRCSTASGSNASASRSTMLIAPSGHSPRQAARPSQ